MYCRYLTIILTTCSQVKQVSLVWGTHCSTSSVRLTKSFSRAMDWKQIMPFWPKNGTATCVPRWLPNTKWSTWLAVPFRTLLEWLNGCQATPNAPHLWVPSATTTSATEWPKRQPKTASMPYIWWCQVSVRALVHVSLRTMAGVDRSALIWAHRRNSASIICWTIIIWWKRRASSILQAFIWWSVPTQFSISQITLTILPTNCFAWTCRRHTSVSSTQSHCSKFSLSLTSSSVTKPNHKHSLISTDGRFLWFIFRSAIHYLFCSLLDERLERDRKTDCG